MISHEHKCIFIHIPKCAGSSVEYFFGVKPFNWRVPNYTNLTGWCPNNSIHLHHASATELLSLNLINKYVWSTYFKFTFIRNPWAKAYSDYEWIKKDRDCKGNFKDYITGKGNFKKYMANPRIPIYRGDHLKPQKDFIEFNGIDALDFIGKVENIKEDWRYVLKILGISYEELPKIKEGVKKYRDYKDFYTPSKIRLINKYYKKDIEEFRYTFGDEE